MMRDAGVRGPIVPWNDVLHEGPVPAGLNIAALRERRAEFLASAGGGSYDSVRRELAERDAVLENRFDEIVLWLEHDLFDQLHLLQILDRLPMDGPPRVTAVPDDEYLGHLSANQFQGLYAARRDVTSAQRSAARDAWTAFRSPDPCAIIDVLPRVTVLPHLAPALLRHLQQFPSTHNGLSRTEQQALDIMSTGATRVTDIFVAQQRREEAFFMGDSGFVYHLGALMRTPRPLIRPIDGGTERPRRHSNLPLVLEDTVELTEDGRLALDSRGDRIRLCGIDRWLGGVHLTGHGPLWRWDGTRRTVRVA